MWRYASFHDLVVLVLMLHDLETLFDDLVGGVLFHELVALLCHDLVT